MAGQLQTQNAYLASRVAATLGRSKSNEVIHVAAKVLSNDSSRAIPIPSAGFFVSRKASQELMAKKRRNLP